MIRILGILCALTMFGTPAAADEGTDGGTSEGADSGDSVYRKKIGGIFWAEVTAGPTRYKPQRLLNNIEIGDFDTGNVPKPTLTGPEFGGALGLRLGSLMLGARVKSANYDVIKLNTASLDMNFLIRIPYVHPYIHLAFNYHWLKGNAGALLPGSIEGITGATYSDTKSRGGGLTLGLGLRIPLLKYLSLALGVDVTTVAILIKGTGSVSAGGMSFSSDVTGGAIGLQTSGFFALTFHI